MLYFLFFISLYSLSYEGQCEYSSCHECMLDANCNYLSRTGCYTNYKPMTGFVDLMKRLEECKTQTVTFKPNPFCPDPSLTLEEDAEYSISPIKSNDVYYSEDNYCYYQFNVKSIQYNSKKKVCFNITNYLSDEANALYVEEVYYKVYQQVPSGNSVLCNDLSHLYNFIYLYLSESECKMYEQVCKNTKFDYDYTVKPFEIQLSVKTIEDEVKVEVGDPEEEEETENKKKKKDSNFGLEEGAEVGGSILGVGIIGTIGYFCCCKKEKKEEDACCWKKEEEEDECCCC